MSERATAQLAVALLRSRSSETELTRCLREVMRQEPELAAIALDELLALAGSEVRRPHGRVVVEGEKPAKRARTLRPEVKLGRVDWQFTVTDHPSFKVIVEVKLDSRPTRGQIRKYERSLHKKVGGVLLLVRDPPPLELAIPGGGYLGPIRWRDLLARLCAHDVPSSPVTALWRAVLEDCAAPGGLGRPVLTLAELRMAEDDRARRSQLKRVVIEVVDELVADAASDASLARLQLSRGSTGTAWARVNVGGPEGRHVFLLKVFLERGDLLFEAFSWPPIIRRDLAGWRSAMRATRREGWTIEKGETRLHVAPRRLPLDAHTPIAAALLDETRKIFRPLSAPPLLPALRGWRGKGGSTFASSDDYASL